MTFRQLAINNIVRNKRTYLAHFLSSAFAVMIFFVYALLSFHPNLQGEFAPSVTVNTFAKAGFKVSQGIIFCFSFLFILYSVSAFLKMRKKEFGILILLGMTRSQLNKMVFIENILIGISAILSGITVGMVFAKFILVLSSALLLIDNSLPFYMPVTAIGITCTAFFFLFLFISLFTSRILKVNQLIELLKSGEKPKPEPKASIWLSLLALMLIGLGYIAAFHSVKAVNYRDSGYVLIVVALGVVFAVTGTYFLFTQLSVYVLRALKKRENIFFRGTNILTISDLMYQLNDNAKMFFMVSIIFSVTFTSVGTFVGLGSSGMAESMTPFAFTYISNKDNKLEEYHIQEIKQQLTGSNFEYELISYPRKQIVDTLYNSGTLSNVMKLSDYNIIAESFGYEKQYLEDGTGSFVIPSKRMLRINPERVTEINSFQLFLDGNVEKNIHVNKTLIMKELQDDIVSTVIVSDSMYHDIFMNSEFSFYERTVYEFIVNNWEKTKEISENLLSYIDNKSGEYSFSSLILTWLDMKQLYGLASILSVLVGMVFFTFATSLLYFRLYADLERIQQHYKMITKIGLRKKELNKIVTTQLALMFFLPILVAIAHSAVAFMALQKLVLFSIMGSSVILLISFLVIQIICFLFVRIKYLWIINKTMLNI